MVDDKILGLAHFTEHMLFLGSKKYPNVTFFNDFITSNEGHFNGYTDKDTTAFFYEINKEKFEESLDIFLNFFVRPLFKPEFIEKEIFAVNSEYEKNIHYEEKRFDRMFQSLANPNHPFSKFSTGNKETIKVKDESNFGKPAVKNEKALRENVIKYFHKNYVGKNIKLVIYSSYAIDDCKKILINNLIKIKNHTAESKNDNRHNHKSNSLLGGVNKNTTMNMIEFFTSQEKGKIIFYKSRYKNLKVFFILDEFNNRGQENFYPKNYLKSVFSAKSKNSLYQILVEHRLIFNYKIDFKNKYKGLYAIYFDFMLTELGLKNIDLILKYLSHYIKIIHKNIDNKEVIEKIANEGNKNFYSRPSIKNPYTHIKKWLKNFYLWDKNNFIKSDNLMNNMKPEILHSIIGNMTLHNMIAFVGSRTFKRVNETYLYSVLTDNHNIEKKEFNNTEFLNKKEKWYKIKFREFKLNDDNILHLYHRKLNDSAMVFPFSNIKFKSQNKTAALLILKDGLCGKYKKKSECEEFYKNDKKILAPSLIFISNNKDSLSEDGKNSLNIPNTLVNLNSTTESTTYYSEIYYKLDRTHLKPSFSINMKIIPNEFNFDLKNKKTVPLLKFLILYLNFKFDEALLNSRFIKNSNNTQIIINFLDNFRLKSGLFKWRNSKEKLKMENFMIDGIYLKVNANSEESFEKSDVYEMIRYILSKQIEKKDFLYLKEELFRHIEFFKSTNPSHQALSWLFRLGFKYDIDYFTMTPIIKQISQEDFNSFKDVIFSDLKFVSLAVGTIAEDKAKIYIQNLEKVFLDNVSSTSRSDSHLNITKGTTSTETPHIAQSNSTLTLSQIKKRQRFMQAPYTKYGSLFIFQQNNLYKYSPDSTTLNAYFLGEQNIRNSANIKIITHIAGNIFFSYLRIKHQLGYSIKHKLVNINRNLIFFIHVQGSKKHPSHTNKYIDKSLIKIKTKLNQIGETSFKNVKETVYNAMIKQSNKLNAKNAFYWGYIQSEDNIFNKDKVKVYLNHLSISDLVKFIDSMLEKKLSIQVANQSDKYYDIDKESIYVKNVDYFRQIGNFKRPDINEKEYEEIIVKPDFNPELIQTFRKINKYDS